MNNYDFNYLNKIILITLFFSLVGCKKLENTIPNDILNNGKKYNQIVETIYESDFSRFSFKQFISKEYFPKKLSSLINQTELKNEVEYLILFENSNCKEYSFELVAGNYNLFYNPCSKMDFPKPNSYRKEGISETWGINKSWFINKTLNDK
jgi:hypothetical protein